MTSHSEAQVQTALRALESVHPKPRHVAWEFQEAREVVLFVLEVDPMSEQEAELHYGCQINPILRRLSGVNPPPSSMAVLKSPGGSMLAAFGSDWPAL